MFFITEKNSKFSSAGFFARFAVFLLLIFFAASVTESFPASNAAEFEQPKIHKKMNQTNQKEVAPGDWGAAGINLAIKKGTATIEFDCAEAQITEKLIVDKKGNFSAGGNYLRRAPGPIRVKSPIKSEPAKFEGKISGAEMSLTIILTKNKEVIGNYVLQRGKMAKIRRCL